MPWTLHLYIIRELGKTFGLTVGALTVLFTLGGGIYNVMRYEGVSIGNFSTLLPMLLPIVVAVTMPIAALFAATIVYGRLAADSEFTACRAAGINVHGLFLPAILLSVLVALVSMFAMNVLIPRSMKNIEFFVRSNIREYVQSKLRQSGYVEYLNGAQRHVIVSRSARRVSPAAVAEAGYEPESDLVNYLWIDYPTYLQIVDGQLEYFGVADGGLCVFDKRAGDVQLSVQVINFKSFSSGRAATVLEKQSFGPAQLPIRLPIRPTMVDLGTLNRWREAPWESPDITERANELITRAFVLDFCRLAAEELRAGRSIAAADGNGGHLTIAAGEAACAEGRLDLLAAVVQHATRPDEPPTRYDGPRGRLSMRVRPDGQPAISLTLERDELGPVRRTMPARRDDHVVLTEVSHDFVDLAPDGAFLSAIPIFTPRQIVRPEGPLAIDPSLTPELEKLRVRAAREERKVAGLIHFRLSYAASSLVTVAMGAILGVMFRGARMLAAFGLACVPFAVVAIVILVGKQLIEGSPAAQVGAAVIWGGLAAAVVTDTLLLYTGVRR